MKRKTISVTVSSTVQAKQYHPVTIAVTETAELSDGDDVKECKAKLYKSVSASVGIYMGKELKKWED